MPRINQLPAASSVAQTDVLAIDTTDKTYKVPRSVLAPAPYIATIPTGQWSGSGSDRYITVTASNVTADAMLYPFYDNASAALLNGPVWVIPAAGSFTIHTSAIPSGTVTISVLLAGIVGEAQYQVLADVYSRSQVDTIVSQSTANFQIPSSTAADLNDCVEPGFYRAGSTTLNRPETGSRYYTVLVMPFSATDRAQIAIEVNLTRMHIRSKEGSTWHAWKTVTLT